VHGRIALVRVGAPTWAAVLGSLLVVGCGATQQQPHRRVVHQLPPAPAPRVHARLRPVRGHYRGPVPILMYHVIGRPPPGAPNPELWVPAGRLRRQLAALERAGYRGVTLSQVWDAWHGGPGLPRRPVVVSFDDGYDSQYRAARPILRRLGWPGVLDLQVGNLHVAGGLSAREVRALLADGWELAAHTVTHPDLTAVGPARLRREVAGSRAALRRRFGVGVRFFCYPGGRYDAAVERAVRAAGFRGATSTAPGIATPHADPFALPRLRVLPEEQPSALLAALR
jgi:peptidoglycan/xylan/chitin deacetylase (PgdA/CDA1 family)